MMSIPAPFWSGSVTEDATASQWDTTNKTGGTWAFTNTNKTAEYLAPTSGLAVQTVVGTVPRSSGKRYFEIVFITGATFGTSIRHDLGATSDTIPLGGGSSGSNTGAGYRRGGAVIANGSNVGAVTALSAGDVVGVALNIGTGDIWFSRNGTWTQGDPGTGASPEATLTASVAYRPFFSAESLAYSQVTLRSLASEFSSSPPSGFVSWATP